jgi:hypothetical protein
MLVKISIGEAIDKLCILDIKRQMIKDPEKLKNINKEYIYLFQIVIEQCKDYYDNIEIYHNLMNINLQLWMLEDAIRKLEKEEDFGEKFIATARKIYIYNDERAKIKKKINQMYNSDFQEEKSF